MTVEAAADRVALRGVLGRLDPTLALAESFDTKAVARRFEREWGAPVAGCSLLRTRYEPGRQCVTTYQLELDRPAGRHTVGVVDLRPSGSSCRDYTEDDALPGVGAAAEPSTVADLVALATGTPVTGCRSRVAGYHPGERAVICYEVETSTSSCTLYGKVLARGAEVLATTLTTLAEAAQADHAFPAAPALIAVAGELGLVLQRGMDGVSLQELLAGEAARGARQDGFRSAGAALAHLHAAGTATPHTATVECDASSLASYLPVVAQADPALAVRMETTAARVRERAPELDGGALVPNHGGLRADHVLLSGKRAGLLDLDGYCRAHPGRDIGNLLAYLRWRTLRRPHEHLSVALAGAAFIRGYRSVASPPADEDLAVFEALSLLKIAGRRFRSLSVEEWPLVPALLDIAAGLLDGSVPA